MRVTTIVILILALAVCGTVALAQAPGAARTPGGARQGMGMGIACPAVALTPPSARMIGRAEVLQLTEDQKTKLTDVLTKGEQTLTPLREAVAKASRALRTSVMGAEADAQKIAGLVSDAQKAELAIINAEVQIWIEIKSVLSADQMTKLQEFLGSRMGGMRGGQNRPGGGGGNGAPPPAPPAPGQ